MKAYPDYKDSGVEWIGNIPSHWKVTRVKFLSKGNAEYGLSINSESFAESGTRFIRTTDIDNNGNLIENGVYLPPDEVDESYKLNDGDFLISRSGTIGRAYIHKSNGEEACYAGYLVRFRFLDLQTARFVYWFTKSGLFQMWLDHNRIESTISNVNGQKYANLSLGVPVSGDDIIGVNNFLDRKTAQIDTLIEKKQRQIDLLQEQRTALINHAVTKGVNPNVRMKDSGTEGLGKIPNHWGVKQLRHIIEEGTSITYGIVQAGPNYEGGIPYIRTQDMSGSELPRDGYLKTSPEIDLSYERSKVNSGDIVIAIRATVGKALVVPEYLEGANLTQGTAKVSPSDIVHNKYLFWAINSDTCQNYISSISKGVTFKEITLYMLRRVRIPFPPLIEQKQISNYLDDKTDEVDLAIERIRKQMDLLGEYRTALISEAVTGKVDVR